MCAIAGIVGHKVEERILRRVAETMKRRGPDANACYCKDDCQLLHSRLAIIDPEGGAQPMKLNWQGQDYVIVYNGEIYNTDEIRHELNKTGHVFFGHSDTEVLLHAYAQWKEKCLDKLNGIYAFAVWEVQNNRLFLARDRMGVKPLFYAQMQNTIVFGSEIKNILASELIKPRLKREGIYQLLLLGPGRTPGSGVFAGIRELKPGYFGYWTDGKFHEYQYWSLKDGRCTDTLQDALMKTRFLVTDAIERQMISDVPIGTFLSGGLDSSLITSICAQRSGSKIPTFSVDYLNNDKYFIPGKFQPDSDGAYISVMNAACETDHTYTVLTPEDLIGHLEHATVARDLPGMADVDFSLLAFCGEIRKRVKVALSGECADEIFGGYPWFRDESVLEQNGFPWSQNISYRLSFLLDQAKDGEAYIHDLYNQTVRDSDVLPETGKLERQRKIMMNLNIKWFMQTLLDRKDRMSMYHGLEVRVPFCDHRIAEYLYVLPWEYKDLMGREKGLLRKAMEGILPYEVLWRKKSPYPKTFDPRYTQIVEDRLRALLIDNTSPLFDLVNRESLSTLLTQDQVWPWYGQLMKRPQTIAYFLQMDYWLRKYAIDFV